MHRERGLERAFESKSPAAMISKRRQRNVLVQSDLIISEHSQVNSASHDYHHFVNPLTNAISFLISLFHPPTSKFSVELRIHLSRESMTPRRKESERRFSASFCARSIRHEVVKIKYPKKKESVEQQKFYDIAVALSVEASKRVALWWWWWSMIMIMGGG